jgi:hypothetical protein
MRTTNDKYEGTVEDVATVGDIAALRKCQLFYPEEHVKIILRTMQNSRVGCAGVINDHGA